MIFYIPTTDTPEVSTHYTQTTALNSVDFELRFDYLQAQDLWCISVYTADLAPLIVGVPIVAGVDLLARCNTDGRPTGTLILIPGTQTPGQLDLGEGRAERLVYLDAI